MTSDSARSGAQTAPISRLRWWILLVLVGAYPLVIGLMGALAGKGGGPALSRGPRGVLVSSGMELGVFGCIFALAWLAARASRDDLLLRWRPGWWVLPLGIGYSLALRVAVAICMGILIGLLVAFRVVTPSELPQFLKANQPDLDAVVDVQLLRDNPLYFWLVITLVSFVVAGLREELWRAGFLAGLRKLWPNWFGSRVGQMGGVVVASVIFGLGHVLMGWLAVLAATLLGLLLGLIMVLHRSIWPAVFAHGLFDATSFALLPLVTELQKASGH